MKGSVGENTIQSYKYHEANFGLCSFGTKSAFGACLKLPFCTAGAVPIPPPCNGRVGIWSGHSIERLLVSTPPRSPVADVLPLMYRGAIMAGVGESAEFHSIC